VPLRPADDDPADALLRADDGTPLARLRLRDDDGPVAAGLRPLADPGRVAAQALRDLADRRLETPDEALAAALVAAGATRTRSATELRHDLADLPEAVPLPAGWSLAAGGWDDDLAAALDAAYGPGHPDQGWTADDTAAVRDMFERADPVPPLDPASARLVGPDGRSAGHVLCAGPVPWTDYECAWVLNIGVGPHAQGLGLGRALLTHALRGARDAGLPTLALSVTDGNPARHLYDRAGFAVVDRVITLRV
jgi:ribosomal protein S18 acetylase RimI-like enzyme